MRNFRKRLLKASSRNSRSRYAHRPIHAAQRLSSAITCRSLIYNYSLVADVHRLHDLPPEKPVQLGRSLRTQVLKQHPARASTMGKRADRKASGPSQARGARSWLLRGTIRIGRGSS